jgi:hypothetical protein
VKAVHDAVLKVTGFKREVIVNDQLRVVSGPSSAGLGFDVWSGRPIAGRMVGESGVPGQALLPVVVEREMPYAVYFGSTGLPSRRRLSGHRSHQSVYFSFRGVGISDEQARWVMQELQDTLEGLRLVVPGRQTGLVSVDGSNRVFRDDEAVQPNGGPVFYGEDYYAVGVKLIRSRGAA